MGTQREESKSAADEPTIGPDQPGTEPKTGTQQSTAIESVGGTIGPYKLLDELGEGGMGTVFLAEQERPVRRRVALKLIKPGLDTAQVIARFEAERQALALMDHAHIARVIDAGTTISGRPYFVMELVQGVPITSYCDSHRVLIRQRIELFLPVCRAVQHAHQKGIIHRDLKPTNILVTLRDDQPVAKIIDFGIAKATTQRLTERTLHTQYGTVVGTPDYMSPEQAGLGGLDVDTRSDVYSLGAVLYELLCGDSPLGHARLKQLDLIGMLNVIYHDEPSPPSRRVSEHGQNATDIARRRDSEPNRLVQSLRGELDWITTKALEKERTRRYESASALAADLERHLNNQPVEASPPSATYRLQKFVRRNRAALAAATMIVFVLITGIIASGWQAYRATQAEHEMGIERQAALESKGQAEKLLTEVQSAKGLADAQKKLAEERGTQLASALTKANQSADSERKTRGEIERRLREADAMRLALSSKDSRQQYPQRALLLAAEAIETTRRKNEPIRSEAYQALREALHNIGGHPLSTQGAVYYMGITPNGRWVFTSDEQSVWRWDLAAENPAEAGRPVGPPSLMHRAPWGLTLRVKAISPDGRRLVTFSGTDKSGKFYLWDIGAEKFDQPLRELDLARVSRTMEAAFSADSRWLVVQNYPTAALWDLSAEADHAKPIILGDESSTISDVEVSANSKWAITRDSSDVASLWNLASGDGNPTPRSLANVGAHLREWLSSDGRWILATLRTNGVNSWTKVWDLNAADPFLSSRQIPLAPHQGDLFGHLLPHARLLALAAGDNISIWDLSAETWTAPKASLSVRDSGVEDDRRDPDRSKLNVHSLQSDRDGRWLFAVDANGLIHRWHLQNTDPQASRLIVGRHPGDGVIELTISGSGRWLVSSRWLVSTRTNGPPRLWDLWSRNPQTTGIELHGHDSTHDNLSYGAVQVAMGGGKLSGLVASTQPQRTMPFLGLGGGLGASLGLGERWLVTRGPDLTLRLWDLTAEDPARAGVRAGRLKIGAGDSDVAVRDDGRWITGSGANLQVLNPDALNPVQGSIVIRPGTFDIEWSNRDLPLSRDGRWLALRTGERISVFDLASEQILGDSKLANDESPAPADKNSSDQAARVWQPAVTGGRWLEQLVFPRFGRNRATAPAAHGPHIVVEPASQKDLDEILISPKGNWLVTQTGFQNRLWRLRGPQNAARADTSVDLGELRGKIFSLDDHWLVTLRWANFRFWLTLWNLSTDPPQSSQHDLGLFTPGKDSLAVSGDGRWMAAAAQRGLWLSSIADDGTFGQPQVLNSELTFLQCVALSRDGRYVAASESKNLHLWRRNQQGSAVQHQVLYGHEQIIFKVEFSPDGAWLVAASMDGDIRLWDLREEQVQGTMITLADDGNRYFRVQRFIFSPDGRWLAASAHNGISFWQLDPVPLLHEAHRVAGRDLTTDELARFRLNSPDVKRERLLREAAAVGRRIDKDPQKVDLLWLRANLLACAGQTKEAIEGLRVVINLNPDDHYPRYQLLALLAQDGDREAYRRASAEMAQRFGNPPSESLEILERVAKGSLFWGDSGADWSKIALLADRAIKQATEHNHWIIPWAQIVKGLAEYRRGNYLSALEWADKALSTGSTNFTIVVPGNFVKAVALAQLDRFPEARAALELAKKSQAALPHPVERLIDSYNDWYMGEIMLREAEAVLMARSSGRD